MAKNSEVYKTAQERAEAFDRFCTNRTMSCGGCVFEKIHCESLNQCRFAWLDLEAEKPLPCPFCGERVYFSEEDYTYKCFKCNYRSGEKNPNEPILAAHNRVAKNCQEAK